MAVMQISPEGVHPVESGMDISLLQENLRHTPTERLSSNQRALVLHQELSNNWPLALGQTRSNMLDSSALLQTLLDHEVRFVLVGGLAMISHGSAHVTKDMDICYDRSPENIQLLVTALKPFHPSLRGVPAGLPFVRDEPTIQAGLNFTLVTDAGELDLLGEITGLGTYETVKQWRQTKTLYGREMPVLSLDGLIRSKQASHRTRDQLHLLELEALKKLLSEIS